MEEFRYTQQYIELIVNRTESSTIKNSDSHNTAFYYLIINKIYQKFILFII